MTYSEYSMEITLTLDTLLQRIKDDKEYRTMYDTSDTYSNRIILRYVRSSTGLNEFLIPEELFSKYPNKDHVTNVLDVYVKLGFASVSNKKTYHKGKEYSITDLGKVYLESHTEIFQKLVEMKLVKILKH